MCKEAESFELAKEVGKIHLIDGHPYVLITIDEYPTFSRLTFREYIKVFLETRMLEFPGEVSYIKAITLFDKNIFQPDVKVEKLNSGHVNIYREKVEY